MGMWNRVEICCTLPEVLESMLATPSSSVQYCPIKGVPSPNISQFSISRHVFNENISLFVWLKNKMAGKEIHFIETNTIAHLRCTYLFPKERLTRLHF